MTRQLKASPWVLSLLKKVPSEQQQHASQVGTGLNLLETMGLDATATAALKESLTDIILHGMGLAGDDGRENIMQLVNSFCGINEWTMGEPLYRPLFQVHEDPEPVGPLLLSGGRNHYGGLLPPRLSLSVRDVISRRLEVACSLARSMASLDEQNEILHRLTTDVVERLNNALDNCRVPSLFELSIRSLIEIECLGSEKEMRETAHTIGELQEEVKQLQIHKGCPAVHHEPCPESVDALTVEELATHLPPAFKHLMEQGKVDGSKLWGMIQAEIAENHSDVAFQRQIEATQQMHCCEHRLTELDLQRDQEWEEALFRYRVCPDEEEVAALNRFRLWLFEVKSENLCGATGELLPPQCPLCAGDTVESARYSVREGLEQHGDAVVGFRCRNEDCVNAWITSVPAGFDMSSLSRCHNSQAGCHTRFLREEWATRCKTCNVPWCSACQDLTEVCRRNFCGLCHQGPYCSTIQLQQFLCNGRASASLGSFTGGQGAIRRCEGCKLRCCNECWGSFGVSCTQCQEGMQGEAAVHLARRYGQALSDSDSDAAESDASTDSGHDAFGTF